MTGQGSAGLAKGGQYKLGQGRVVLGQLWVDSTN